MLALYTCKPIAYYAKIDENKICRDTDRRHNMCCVEPVHRWGVTDPKETELQKAVSC